MIAGIILQPSKLKEIRRVYQLKSGKNDLTASEIQNLIELSAIARTSAYTPYSKFDVGAAILCRDGTIYTGCNVENSSYSLTVCAERTAAVKAVSDGKKEFVAVSVCAVLNEDFVFPCGSCRQFLAEFATTDFMVYVVKPDDLTKCKKAALSDLLPNSFKIYENHRN